MSLAAASALWAWNANADIPKMDVEFLAPQQIGEILRKSPAPLHENKINKLEYFRKNTHKDLNFIEIWFFRHNRIELTIKWFVQNYDFFRYIADNKEYLSWESIDIFKKIMLQVSEMYLEEIWTPAILAWNEIEIITVTDHENNTDPFILLFWEDIKVPWWFLESIIIKKTSDNSIVISHSGIKNPKQFIIK